MGGVAATYEKDCYGKGGDYAGCEPDHSRLHDQREALLPGSDAVVECQDAHGPGNGQSCAISASKERTSWLQSIRAC
jgi:hypothetical protein